MRSYFNSLERVLLVCPDERAGLECSRSARNFCRTFGGASVARSVVSRRCLNARNSWTRSLLFTKNAIISLSLTTIGQRLEYFFDCSLQCYIVGLAFALFVRIHVYNLRNAHDRPVVTPTTGTLAFDISSHSTRLSDGFHRFYD